MIGSLLGIDCGMFSCLVVFFSVVKNVISVLIFVGDSFRGLSVFVVVIVVILVGLFIMVKLLVEVNVGKVDCVIL